jgi:hypothetical protein
LKDIWEGDDVQCYCGPIHQTLWQQQQQWWWWWYGMSPFFNYIWQDSSDGDRHITRPLQTLKLSWDLPCCHTICPAASRSREQVFCWLLRKFLYSIPLLLIICLSLLSVNGEVKPVCAGVGHFWRVSPHAILWASGRRIGAEQMFPTRLVQKPSSVPTPLPARPLCGYQDYLPIQHLLA